MHLTIFISLLVTRTSIAQVNGEFWWLSDKVTKLKGVTRPPPAKFEELSEFDTDESAKIIFRDDNFNEINTLDNNNIVKKSENNWESESIIWPDDASRVTTISSLNTENTKFLLSFITQENTTSKNITNMNQNSGDIFIFKYPEDDNFGFKDVPKADLFDESSDQNITKKTISRDSEVKLHESISNSEYEKIPKLDTFAIKFPDDDLATKFTSEPVKKVAQCYKNEQGKIDSNKILNPLTDEKIVSNKDSALYENICTYMKNNECDLRNGVAYAPKKGSRKFNNPNQICCVLPLSTIESHRIVFPDSPEIQSKRFRRSNKDETANTSLRQREFLMRQKFRPQSTGAKPTSQTKIVTPDEDDYVDPYLNVKGSYRKKQNKHSSNKQDYNYADYIEDYVVELPKPGLVGLYSDNGNRPPWSFANDNDDRPNPPYGGSVDDSDEYDEQPFGYGTIDPRRGTSKAPTRGRPLKLTTTTPDEVSLNVESQTVSFQSSPNFQVLEGFKLLNLGRTRNKFYSRNNRRSTTEGNFEDESKEPEEFGSHSGIINGNINEQVFENCGKTRKLFENNKNNKQFGEAESGSHPWMALVVLTRRPQGILCYATIVHPRAAVTAGACVYGRTSSKEVTLIAGLWNLNNRLRGQNRAVTVQLHPQYRPKVLAHDLAMLHWITPLRLNANIQPACLGSTHETEDCKFFGWGGFDQGIRPKSRWQRASFLPAQECVSLLGNAVAIPHDGFCATVTSRGTVTGIGGSLICTVNGRKATTGIAVWRDNALVLIPAQEWLIRAFEDLNIV